MIDNPPISAGQPFKILMTADAVGGVWQYCVDLAAGLAGYGCEVIIATSGPRPSPTQQDQVRAIPGAKLIESDYALEWMPNSWDAVDQAGSWLTTLDAQFNPQIIHLNGYAHAGIEWRKPVIVAAHSCVYSWWRAVHGCSPGSEWSKYKRRVTAGLRAADIVVAPSCAMALAIEAEYGACGEKTRVIYNFSRAPRSRNRKKEPFCLAVGRLWDPAKNVALLERLSPNNIGWQIRLAGREHGPENSTVSVKSLHFLGPLSHNDVLDEMSRAAIYLHPALYEPFGLSILEAARNRCCLLLSDIPSLRELWEGAAVFVDPRDPDRWSSELHRLIKDPGKRNELAWLAYSHAARYGAALAVSQYWALYQSLLASKRTAAKEVAA